MEGTIKTLGRVGLDGPVERACAWRASTQLSTRRQGDVPACPLSPEHAKIASEALSSLT